MVNTALPKIAADLRSSLTGIQWIVDAYTVAFAAAVLRAGSGADRIGRRRMFTAGMALFTATSLVCGRARHRRARRRPGAAGNRGGDDVRQLAGDPRRCLPDRRAAGAFAAYGATIGASFAVGPVVGGAMTSG